MLLSIFASSAYLRQSGLRQCLLLCILTSMLLMYTTYHFVVKFSSLNFASSATLVNTTKKTHFKYTSDGNRTTKASLHGERAVGVRSGVCKDPGNLIGALNVDFDTVESTLSELTRIYSLIRKNDGTFALFQPQHCKAASTIAIIIPFRDRKKQLLHLLGHLHLILQRQLQRYQIFVVEQDGNSTFNKGKLMNAAFQFIKGTFGKKFDCYIFHDVDLLSEDDRNIYRCGTSPSTVRHLSCAISKFGYKWLCCGMTVGGVLAFTRSQYRKVNGFSNNYWGWGGEDDDMSIRIFLAGFTVERPHPNYCRYLMVEHNKDKMNDYVPNKVNNRVSSARQHASTSGLSDLNTILIEHKVMPLYVHLLVEVGQPANAVTGNGESDQEALL